MEKGFVHIYHGDGKGKTTAAVGLAVRAAGAGLRVLFTQFMKDGGSSELAVLRGIDGIDVNAVENHFGFTWSMTDKDRRELKVKNDTAVSFLLDTVRKEKYGMIVLDEIMSADQSGLVERDALFELIRLCRGRTELVLTGRNPSDEMKATADYITEMKCERHPYEKGVGARLGIEL